MALYGGEEELYGGEELLYGGGDEELYGGEELLYGGEDDDDLVFGDDDEAMFDKDALPYHNPSSVARALNKAAADAGVELTESQRALDRAARSKGMRISTIAMPACPTGPDNWVTTKSAWTECENKMGFRWRTPEGWCYPEGLCAIDDSDLVTRNLVTYRKSELLQRIIAFGNALAAAERDKWLGKRAASMVASKKKMFLPKDGDTDGKGKYEEQLVKPYLDMTEAQQQAFADQLYYDMPTNLRNVSTDVVVETQRQLESAARSEATLFGDAYTDGVRDARKPENVRSLMTAMSEAGMTDTTTTEAELRRRANAFYDAAAKCVDKQVGRSFDDAKRTCAATPADKCSFYEPVPGEPYGRCLSEDMAKRADKWKGGEADPMAAWLGAFTRQRAADRARDSASTVAKYKGIFGDE